MVITLDSSESRNLLNSVALHQSSLQLVADFKVWGHFWRTPSLLWKSHLASSERKKKSWILIFLFKHTYKNLHHNVCNIKWLKEEQIQNFLSLASWSPNHSFKLYLGQLTCYLQSQCHFNPSFLEKVESTGIVELYPFYWEMSNDHLS